jgi:hypothetical protein
VAHTRRSSMIFALSRSLSFTFFCYIATKGLID